MTTTTSSTDGIREMVDGIPFVLNKAGRRFIQEGSLDRLLNRSVKSPYYLYLFSDIIVYAQRRKKPPHKYITHKYLASCLFVDYADSSKGLRYAFEIKNLDDKKTFDETKGPQEKEEFVFLAKNLDQKNGWKRDIEKQINFAADLERVETDGSGAFNTYVSGFSDPSEPSSISSSSTTLSGLTTISEHDDGVSTANNSVSPPDIPSSMSRSPSDSTLSTTPDNWSTSSCPEQWSSQSDEEVSFDLDERQIGSEGPIMGQTEDGNAIVQAASVSFITWFLVCGDHSDTSLIQSFLFAYRAFTTPLDLLEILKEIYSKNMPPNELPIKYSQFDTRRKVASFLRIWILKYFPDNFDSKVMLTKALDFIYEISKTHIADANQLKIAMLRSNRERIAKKTEKKKRNNSQMNSRAPSETIASKSGSVTNVSPLAGTSISSSGWGNKFVEFSLAAVADYLTFSEHSLFQQVALNEFAKMAWMNPKHSKKLAPNIVMSTHKFNQISQWVSTEIVLSNTPKLRAVMIERFVSLASKCVDLRNYHTLMEILAGINRGYVDRLKKSWNLVSSSTMETLQQLNDLMDPKQNFKNYRETLRKASIPCLPYFGIFLRDIVFAEEGNPDKNGELINFEKIQILGKIYKDVLTFQRGRYASCDDDAINLYFKNLWVMPDEVLFQHSRMHEPSANANKHIDETT